MNDAPNCSLRREKEDYWNDTGNEGKGSGEENSLVEFERLRLLSTGCP
jgi:hypothetical protein